MSPWFLNVLHCFWVKVLTHLLFVLVWFVPSFRHYFLIDYWSHYSSAEPLWICQFYSGFFKPNHYKFPRLNISLWLRIDFLKLYQNIFCWPYSWQCWSASDHTWRQISNNKRSFSHQTPLPSRPSRTQGARWISLYNQPQFFIFAAVMLW